MATPVSRAMPTVLDGETIGRHHLTRLWRNTDKTYWIVEHHHLDVWAVNALRWTHGTLAYTSIYFATGDRHRKRCFASALYRARRACVRDAESRCPDR